MLPKQRQKSEDFNRFPVYLDTLTRIKKSLVLIFKDLSSWCVLGLSMLQAVAEQQKLFDGLRKSFAKRLFKHLSTVFAKQVAHFYLRIIIILLYNEKFLLFSTMIIIKPHFVFFLSRS